MEYRMERDSMGEMKVPVGARYGAQTARAVENFPISGLRFQRRFIWALGKLKKHAAYANGKLGLLDAEVVQAIFQAAGEVEDGKWDAEFVVDVFQTGSGTSTNMNANEVIANRATELLGGKLKVHPNDHVNQGQSSNDVIPSAMHLSIYYAILLNLLPSLDRLLRALLKKEQEFDDIIKIGRTHLQDATPMTLGQEFSGYVSQVSLTASRLRNVQSELRYLALGGTAIGTGINTHPQFAREALASLRHDLCMEFLEARNHFEAQAARDAVVEVAAVLKVAAVSLMKIANDIRFLGSGPRLGYGELILPATQPGSSIMPGKINPVMCEMLMQICAQVIGTDAVVTVCGTHGNFELNVMMPVMTWNILHSIEILSRGVEVFAARCVDGLKANREKCESNIEQSLARCTALAPIIGYDNAAALAKTAYESNRTVREVAYETSGLTQQQVDQALDPKSQLKPASSGSVPHFYTAPQ